MSYGNPSSCEYGQGNSSLAPYETPANMTYSLNGTPPESVATNHDACTEELPRTRQASP